MTIFKKIKLIYHFLFHKKYEIWELMEFKEGIVGDDKYFYLSNHKLTCSKCNIEHEANRCWLKAGSYWPSGLGQSFEDAKKDAEKCNAYS
jgi:hypothetical protein